MIPIFIMALVETDKVDHNWQDMEQKRKEFLERMQYYYEDKSLESGEMRCPETKEFIDIEWCNSSGRGRGCRNKENCFIYKELLRRKNAANL